MYAYSILTPDLFIAAAVVLVVLDTLCVCLRFYSKYTRAVRYEIEDWLVIPAWICMIAIGGLILYGVETKSEGYFANGGAKDYRNSIARMIYWNVEWLQCISLGCVKLSFLFLYYRLFTLANHPYHVFNLILYIMMSICTIWAIGFFLGAMLTCPGHVSAYWTNIDRSKYCFNTKPYLYALAWSDVGTDLIIILLPVPLLLRLHMSMYKKIGVVGAFMLGGLELALSLTRAILYIGLLGTQNGYSVARLPEWQDPLMQSANGVYWIVLEVGVAVIAVNLPVLNNLARREGLQTMVHQLRSIISLRSRHSDVERASSHSDILISDKVIAAGKSGGGSI